MEITGRLIQIMPTVSGESARGQWVRGGFVIETEESYPRKVAFTLFGEDRLAMLNNLVINGKVNVVFSPESREYNERWYTDLRCINVFPVTDGASAASGSAHAAAAPAQQATPFAQPPASTMPSSGEDDLPF